LNWGIFSIATAQALTWVSAARESQRCRPPLRSASLDTVLARRSAKSIKVLGEMDDDRIPTFDGFTGGEGHGAG
jgi:hypothetical protein